MALYSDLNKLFPFSSSTGCLSSASILESSTQSKVKKLNWTSSTFSLIDTSLVKSLTSFFQANGSPGIFNFDCDGIVLFEEKGNKYIFLTELKSTFDSRDIFKAKDQIISSYIKINMILNLLPNYNPRNYIFKGFIVTLEPPKGTINSIKRSFFRRPLTGNLCITDEEFTIGLHDSTCTKPYILKPTCCSILKQLPLGNNCLFSNLEFNYIKVPSTHSEISVDVNQYI